jgi:hypothetical protein
MNVLQNEAAPDCSAIDRLNALYAKRDDFLRRAEAAVENAFRDPINVAVEAVQREATPCTNS